MQWDFSPEDVVKGRVGYGLGDFRADLAREVRLNSPGADEARLTRTFNLLYDYCHWLARGEESEDFLASCAYDPPACDFLRDIHSAIAPNVAMLGAILQRMIVDGIEAGMTLETALAQVEADHRHMANGGLPAENAGRLA